MIKCFKTDVIFCRNWKRTWNVRIWYTVDQCMVRFTCIPIIKIKLYAAMCVFRVFVVFIFKTSIILVWFVLVCVSLLFLYYITYLFIHLLSYQFRFAHSLTQLSSFKKIICQKGKTADKFTTRLANIEIVE